MPTFLSTNPCACALRSLTSLASVAALVVATAFGAGCATYHDQLARGQRAFEASEYERTLVLLKDLEPDSARLNTAEHAQYAYLRGMSEYRIGRLLEARHWLALAKAEEEAKPGLLPAEWTARTNEALTEMNKHVYDGGIVALSASTAPSEGAEKTDTTDKKSDDAGTSPTK